MSKIKDNIRAFRASMDYIANPPSEKGNHHMSNISPIIDSYATICAQIAELERTKAKLKKELQFLEEGTHEGDNFILTVSLSERSTLDMDAVREKLSAQFIRAHTTTSPVVTFRTKARVQVGA